MFELAWLQIVFLIFVVLILLWFSVWANSMKETHGFLTLLCFFIYSLEIYTTIQPLYFLIFKGDAFKNNNLYAYLIVVLIMSFLAISLTIVLFLKQHKRLFNYCFFTVVISLISLGLSWLGGKVMHLIFNPYIFHEFTANFSKVFFEAIPVATVILVLLFFVYCIESNDKDTPAASLKDIFLDALSEDSAPDPPHTVKDPNGRNCEIIRRQGSEILIKDDDGKLKTLYKDGGYGRYSDEKDEHYYEK